VAVYETTKSAVDECRAGRGPVLIEVKTMRMKGHAQHDPAEYVPPEMFEHWKARDPIALYEKYLTENKIWDAKTKQEIDARIESELNVEQQFAEDSPMPPPELAEEGVYCEGCHTIEADWQRPKEEVMPPKSSINTDWNLAGLGGFGDKVEGSRQTAGQANAQPTSHATSTAHVQTPRGQQPGGRSQNFNSGGNGAKQQKHGSKHGGKPVAKAQPRQQHPRQQPPAQRQPQYAPQPEPEPTDGPRIPFGRGPKGKLGRG
jgi:hypothetical protein